MRVISRVEYGNQTDQFVLPINEQGLPIVDSYLATYLMKEFKKYFPVLLLQSIYR